MMRPRVLRPQPRRDSLGSAVQLPEQPRNVRFILCRFPWSSIDVIMNGRPAPGVHHAD